MEHPEAVHVTRVEQRTQNGPLRARSRIAAGHVPRRWRTDGIADDERVQIAHEQVRPERHATQDAENPGQLLRPWIPLLLVAGGEVRCEERQRRAPVGDLDLEQRLRKLREPVVVRAADREAAQPRDVQRAVCLPELELEAELVREVLGGGARRLEQRGDVRGTAADDCRDVGQPILAAEPDVVGEDLQLD